MLVPVPYASESMRTVRPLRGSLTASVSPVSLRLSEPAFKTSAPAKASAGGEPPPKTRTARPASSVVFAGKVNRIADASEICTPDSSTGSDE
jgi:hypothetical protein